MAVVMVVVVGIGVVVWLWALVRLWLLRLMSLSAAAAAVAVAVGGWRLVVGGEVAVAVLVLVLAAVKRAGGRAATGATDRPPHLLAAPRFGEKRNKKSKQSTLAYLGCPKYLLAAHRGCGSRGQELVDLLLLRRNATQHTRKHKQQRKNDSRRNHDASCWAGRRHDDDDDDDDDDGRRTSEVCAFLIWVLMSSSRAGASMPFVTRPRRLA